MAIKGKQGLAPVPRLDDQTLQRFLTGLRNSVVELKGLSELFGGLSESQQRVFLANLSTLAKEQKGTVKTVDGLAKQVDELLDAVTQQGNDLTTLKQKVANLEQQVKAIQDQLKAPAPTPSPQ